MFVISNQITHRLNLLDPRTRSLAKNYLTDWLSKKGDLEITSKYRDRLREYKLRTLVDGYDPDFSEISNHPLVVEIVKIWSDDVLYRSALKLDARRQGMDPMGDSDFFGLLET